MQSSPRRRRRRTPADARRGERLGRPLLVKGSDFEDFTDGLIEALTEHFPQKTSPLSTVLFYRVDGAYSALAEDATAFSGGRSPRFGVFIIGVCPAPPVLSGEQAWVRSVAEAMPAYAVGDGSYVNGSSEFDDMDPVAAAYGAAKFGRLVELKSKYDPADVLHGNARVAPIG